MKGVKGWVSSLIKWELDKGMNMYIVESPPFKT